jgi:hypothetical protein
MNNERIMIRKEQKELLLESMIELLELPDSAYEKTKARYNDLGNWLKRPGSKCKENSPHVFTQGSFRLGTAIKPLDPEETYDLDLSCKLSQGISKDSHTQRELKELVGIEIENYRIARNIQDQKEEKHRCWRLKYQDDLSFHMDIVPCIPADDKRRNDVFEAIKGLNNELLSKSISDLTVNITDNRNANYSQINNDWKISNPEGYALWFESRMKLVGTALIKMRTLAEGRVEELPAYSQKLPLQRVIQLLKRHRDKMFENDPDLKPISIIISTLAATAYQGETDIVSALENILSKMEGLINSVRPRIPNPVDPNEDFADKWLNDPLLERNFRNWIYKAQKDFKKLGEEYSAKIIIENVDRDFSLKMDVNSLEKQLGLISAPFIITSPKEHIIPEVTAKPWYK